MKNLPQQIMVCDIEATHKIVSCAEIITIAFIKCDLQLNVIEKRSWEMAPLLWNESHDGAALIHGISRDKAMSFPCKKTALREIFKWFGKDRYIFAGHFNRDVFGSRVSYDYALLGQEFFDQSYEAYSRFGRIFPRQYICSTHTLASYAHEKGIIHVPLTVKAGNKNASRDFGLKSICKIMGIEQKEHHNADDDARVCLEIMKKLSEKINIFEVIINDWRKLDEQDCDALQEKTIESNRNFKCDRPFNFDD